MVEPISVVIITYNEARRLEPCLRSVAFAAEIVVVDSGSNDSTQELATRYGARVITQPWLGYGAQKQFAVDQSRHDWVLCVDADERVSDELRANIERAMQHPTARAYQMPRRNRFLGRWLAHGEGYPDFNLRLFDRRVARWSPDAIHEHVLTPEPVATLHGDLLHESQETLAQYLDKQNRYTTLQAQRLLEQGADISVARMVMSPLVRFVKFYIVRQGFRDGVPGLVHIAIGCWNSFIKYAKLRELRQERSQL